MPDAFCVQSILDHLLKAYSPLAIAYSGGLDSRFLAFMAKRLEQNGVLTHLYFFQGPHMRELEIREARNWAKQNGLPLTILKLSPLEHPEVRSNEQERCYHCKRILFQALYQELSNNSPFPGQNPTICDGSTTSDREGYRPGQRALKELSIHSPLAEAGLGKDDIRRIAAELGLDNPEQHSRPCLLTRYAYGLAAEEASLEALDRAETTILRILKEAVKDHTLPELPEFRLRLVGGPSGGKQLSAFQVELHISGSILPSEELNSALRAAATEQGFSPPLIRHVDAISGHYDCKGETGQ